MYRRLTPPDPRICQQCHGMRWYYLATPGRNKPLEAELKQCQRPHAESVTTDPDRNTETVLFTS